MIYLKAVAGHSNIVRLFRVIRSKNKKDLYLIFEYVESDLHKVINADVLNELQQKFILY